MFWGHFKFTCLDAVRSAITATVKVLVVSLAAGVVALKSK